MQVVSGPIGRQRVHFEAPPAQSLDIEMRRLLAWINGAPNEQRERKSYFEILERTQKGSLDVTEWLAWFIATLHRAIDQAQVTLAAVRAKARFWQRFAVAIQGADERAPDQAAQPVARRLRR